MIKKLTYVFGLFCFFHIGLASEVKAQEIASATGSATWYGARHQGKKTSSGEPFNKNQFTAAHKKLPFGTKVKVTNLANQESVVVRINDRGSFKRDGHIIDLSEAAARKIKATGHAQVRVEVLGPAAAPAEPALVTTEPLDSTQILPVATPLYPDFHFVIQVGSFADQTKARLQSDKIKAFQQNLPIVLHEDTINGQKVHRVVAGKFPDRAAAEQARAELAKNGILGLIKQIPGS